MNNKKKQTNARIFLNSIPKDIERPAIMREREGGLISVGDGVMFEWQRGVYGGINALSVVIQGRKIIYSFCICGAVHKKDSHGTMNFSSGSIEILIRILTEYFIDYEKLAPRFFNKHKEVEGE